MDYLRDGELLCPDDKIVQKKLLKEAKFFQVQGIIALLEGEISPPLSSAIFKNENHHSTVMSWLPIGATYSLLYRATTDGKSPADFHRCCDNKGPTLVVMRSGEYIFGGYTSKPWESRMLSISMLLLFPWVMSPLVCLFVCLFVVFFPKQSAKTETPNGLG